LEGASKRSGNISRSSALAVTAVAGAAFVSREGVVFLATARALAVFLAGCLLAVIFILRI
jgi:hypothetical protein